MKHNALQKLKNAGIDADEGIARLMNNEPIYIKYLKKFAHGDEYYTALLESFKRSDCEAAFRAAHTLRGNVGNLGINTMYTILIDMTEALRVGDMESQHHALSNLSKAHRKACKTIIRVLGN